MDQSKTTRERIVETARALHNKGNTWKEVADKLDIGTSTLRRYRNDPEYKRGGSKKVGNTVKEKMNRGGKLTQLEKNHVRTREGDTPETPPGGDRGLPGDGGGGVPIRPNRDLKDLLELDRPNLPNQALNKMKGENPKLDAAIERGDTIDITVYEYNVPGKDEQRYEIGPTSDALELNDVQVITVDASQFQDAVEMESWLWQRLLELEILGNTP